MKKHLFYAAAACALLFAGCKPEEQPAKWDHENTDITILVQDSQGRNLLSDLDENGDPVPNSFVGNMAGINIEYNGQTYSLSGGRSRASKPDLPVWRGFRFAGYRTDARLLFGEFSIDTKDYHEEPFTINWGDGTKSEVKFDLYATPGATDKDQPTVRQKTWVDGKVSSETLLVVTIIK